MTRGRRYTRTDERTSAVSGSIITICKGLGEEATCRFCTAGSMSATFRLDHVVIRVRDLEEACADYRALGFTVTPGGEHPTLGTRNALIPFEDDTYLELIAFPPREVPADAQEKPVHGRWRRWEAASEGLV